MPTLNDKKKKKLAFPSSILMLFIIIVIITILTWIVPGGSFDRVLDEETGQTTVVPDSFQYTEKTPVGPFDMFVLPVWELPAIKITIYCRTPCILLTLMYHLMMLFVNICSEG